MNMIRLAGFNIIGILLPIFFSGCMLTTQFIVTNKMTSSITISSYHSGQSITIAPERKGCVMHTYGDLTIKCSSVVRTYKDLSPLEFRKTEWSHINNYVFARNLTVKLVVAQNGSIYVLPARGNFNSDIQPYGYPLAPESIVISQDSELEKR